MSFSKEIIEIFDYIGDKFGIAIDWSNANVMPYLQELCQKYINWEIATSVVWIIIGLICLALCVPIYKKIKQETNDDDGDVELYILYFFALVTLLIISIPIICNQVFDIVKCICLPELQIYEYVNKLIKASTQ